MSERQAAEAYLALGVLFGVVSLGFYGLGVMVDGPLPEAGLTAYIMGAAMTAIATYCMYVAYCGFAD